MEESTSIQWVKKGGNNEKVALENVTIHFRCRGVLLIWMRVGQGPTALAVDVGWGCLDIFTLVRHFSFQHTFISPSAFSRRTVVSYWRKYVHGVLVNRLGGLSLPRKSVVRLTDRPDMTLDVYRGRKTTIQQYNNISLFFLPLSGRRPYID